MEGTFEEVCTLNTVFNLIETHATISAQASITLLLYKSMEGTFEEVCTLNTVFNLIDTHVTISVQALRLWRGHLKRYVL